MIDAKTLDELEEEATEYKNYYAKLYTSAAYIMSSHVLSLISALRESREDLKKMLPIVEAAYWDHYSAFMLPGAGYSNKAQNLASRTWNCRFGDSSEFEKWKKNLAGKPEGKTE